MKPSFAFPERNHAESAQLALVRSRVEFASVRINAAPGSSSTTTLLDSAALHLSNSEFEFPVLNLESSFVGGTARRVARPLLELWHFDLRRRECNDFKYLVSKSLSKFRFSILFCFGEYK